MSNNNNYIYIQHRTNFAVRYDVRQKYSISHKTSKNMYQDKQAFASD